MQHSEHSIGTAEEPVPLASLRAWLAVFLPAVVLYGATASRGAQWQDSGFHVLRVVTGEPLNPLGLALSHPLHHWLGRLAVAQDLLEPCFAVTLISALAGAVAVAFTYTCVFNLTSCLPASWLAAVSLGLANTFWQMATLVETYALAAALLSMECHFLILYARGRRPRHLLLLCLFNGLGISNHLLALLTTPVVAGVAIWSAKRKDIQLGHLVALPAIWLAGSSLYGGMVLAELIRSGDYHATLTSAMVGHSFADEVLNLSLSVRSMQISAGFLVLCFPNLLLPAAVYGIARAKRLGIPQLSRWSLLAALLIHVWFVARYDIIDKHTFHVPAYVLTSIFGGVGFAAMLTAWSIRARRGGLIASTVFLSLTPLVYAAVPNIARRCGVLRSVGRHKPYRDDYVYLFTPWSFVERSAERMSRQAVTLAGDSGVILIEDSMAEFAIRYRALQDRLDGVLITRAITPELIANAHRHGRPVVLVPHTVAEPPSPPPVGSWQRIGDLYRLTTVANTVSP